MKVVIYTQYEENYGAHDWDGKGECPQYWKMKGGSTFVIEGLTAEQANKAVDSGCPNLCAMIECDTHVAREYVRGIVSKADDAKIADPWEVVTKLSYEGGKWVAREVEDNEEYGYMRKEIARKMVEYTLAPNGERKDAKVEFVLRDGRVVGYDKLGEALGEQAVQF